MDRAKALILDMKSDSFLKNAHLYLGLSRQEFARRVREGEIDCEILKAQIEQNSYEMIIETQCEKHLSAQAIDQVDKFAAVGDSSLS